MNTAIYEGSVFHRRIKPKPHRFRYGVYSILFDISELDFLDQNVAGFGYNRPAPFSFYNKDHGPRNGSNLAQWCMHTLADHDIELNNPSFRVLCFPRVFGIVFNPISVWFCYEQTNLTEQLSAIIYEVHNTFGTQHSYVVDTRHTQQNILTHGRRKRLYVSPFFHIEGGYNFRLRPIHDNYHLNIRYYSEDNELQLVADHQAKRLPFTPQILWSMFWRKPLVTAKVIAGIHWEALHLYTRKNVHNHLPRSPKNTQLSQPNSSSTIFP